MKQKQDEIDKLRGQKEIREGNTEKKIQRKRAKFDPKNSNDEERKREIEKLSGQIMAQVARDKKNEFKVNQKNRLSVLLKTAGLSLTDNERLVRAFFDI